MIYKVAMLVCKKYVKFVPGMTGLAIYMQAVPSKCKDSNGCNAHMVGLAVSVWRVRRV